MARAVNIEIKMDNLTVTLNKGDPILIGSLSLAASH